MKLIIILLLFPFKYINSFININFGPSINADSKNLNYNIDYKLLNEDKNIISKINGFYGLIGPNINKSTITSLYDLFTGDGIVQGLFFDNGNLTFINHLIKTDKLVYEDKNGKIPQNTLVIFFFMIMNKLNLLPNLMGMANTALLNVENKMYALFERDYPYLLDINFKNKTLNTLNKVKLESISHFSAHSKYDNENKVIESIDYNILQNSISYYAMNSDFKIINSTKVFTKYMPIIHDFVNLSNKIIFVDSPIELDINLNNINSISKMPVMMNKSKNTRVIIINKNDFSKKVINVNNSFYVFHYGDFYENDNFIEIYATFYDSLDFRELNLFGKYRRLVINKENYEYKIDINEELEKYNLDFPLKYENKVILRNIKDNKINGFIITQGLKIKKKIFFENKYLCGEPSIINISDNNLIKYYLISLYYDNNNYGYFMLIDLKTYKKIEIPLNKELNIGFHSIFVKKII